MHGANKIEGSHHFAIPVEASISSSTVFDTSFGQKLQQCTKSSAERSTLAQLIREMIRYRLLT
jgi:hypothetical protein